MAVLFTFCQGNQEMTEEHKDIATEESPPGNPLNVLSLFNKPSNLANLISGAMKREEEEEREGEVEENEKALVNSTLSSSLMHDANESISSSSLSSPLASFLSSIASFSLAATSSDSPSDDDGGVQFSPASSSQVS